MNLDILNCPCRRLQEYFLLNSLYGNDKFVTESTIYQYKYYDYDYSNNLKTYFFTDRAIYRPGQTIYFKGIMLRQDKTGKKFDYPHPTNYTVTFYDVNYQKVSDLELTSNDYGTFTGYFTAPAAITGQVYITNGSGNLYFSVEEYKRPKFEVEIDSVKGTYKLNEIYC